LLRKQRNTLGGYFLTHPVGLAHFPEFNCMFATDWASNGESCL